MSPDDISTSNLSTHAIMPPEPSLPLTEPTFFILLSLAPAPNHGYGIMKTVEQLSDSRIKLSTGTLYGALKRLLDDDWIERVDDDEPDPSENGRPRKAYRLTRLGRRRLEAETARLERMVATARAARSPRRI
jgi:DNA-binding PadR family transcriptional regulator